MCLTFGWQMACAGSKQRGTGEGIGELPLCLGVCILVHLYSLIAFTKVNVKCLHYAQVTLVLNKSFSMS